MMQQPNVNQPAQEEHLDFDEGESPLRFNNQGGAEPNYAAGLEQNLDDIALAHQLRMEA
jgi:hypothetical protein